MILPARGAQARASSVARWRTSPTARPRTSWLEGFPRGCAAGEARLEERSRGWGRAVESVRAGPIWRKRAPRGAPSPRPRASATARAAGADALPTRRLCAAGAAAIAGRPSPATRRAAGASAPGSAPKPRGLARNQTVPSRGVVAPHASLPLPCASRRREGGRAARSGERPDPLAILSIRAAAASAAWLLAAAAAHRACVSPSCD